ncbi:hypothetical protein Hdeb2414_s0011g00361241 [Helianthus debilis subsp. tardiflorus]
MDKTSDSRVLKKIFSDLAKGIDIFEDKSEEDLEQEYLDKFYENRDVEYGFLDEKVNLQEYVEEFFKKEFEIERQRQKEKYGEGMLQEKAILISKDDEELIENDLIIKRCLDLTDMIMLHEELISHELFYEVSFEEVVIEDDTWNKIALQCGFDCEDAQEVKIAYARYVELLEWYFDMMKIKRKEKENNGSEEHEAGPSKAKDDEGVKIEENEEEPDLVIILEVTGKKDE